MNTLEWKDGNLPVSTQFNDPYYSAHDGRAETRHVFIESNDLQSRWPDMTYCIIAELGFGTGLNFLETVHSWQKLKQQAARLHFISYEQFPIQSKDMKKALSRWPELASLTSELCKRWKTDDGKLDIAFTDDVRLTVHFGDANLLISNQTELADAWYLDGFAPSRNPELWNEELMQQVFNHTAPDGSFATYTAAGFVRRGLQAAGFQVNKVSGFGTKREMLTGKKIGDNDVANRH